MVIPAANSDIEYLLDGRTCAVVSRTAECMSCDGVGGVSGDTRGFWVGDYEEYSVFCNRSSVYDGEKAHHYTLYTTTSTSHTTLTA